MPGEVYDDCNFAWDYFRVALELPESIDDIRSRSLLIAKVDDIICSNTQVLKKIILEVVGIFNGTL